MYDMDRHTGEWITGWDYIFQAIDDLFTTRVRERVHRRPYGSAIPDAIDRPENDALVLDTFVAAAEAIHQWLSKIVRLVDLALIEMTANGKMRLRLDLQRTDTGELASYEAVL